MPDRVRCKECKMSLPQAAATIVEGETHHQSCAPSREKTSLGRAFLSFITRDPTLCPACGTEIDGGRRPHGYDRAHCDSCADRIEARQSWHLQQGREVA